VAFDVRHGVGSVGDIVHGGSVPQGWMKVGNGPGKMSAGRVFRRR
jgi:hypothetical protein